MNSRVALLFTFALGTLAFFGFAQSAQAAVRIIDHGGTYFGDVFVERGQIVEGDVDVLGGTATIDGMIRGDLTVTAGNISLRPGSIITGKMTDIGGTVSSGSPFDAPVETSFVQDGRVLWKIGTSAIVLLLFLIFPLRTRMALDRLERHPGLCAGIGVVGWVAILPLALLFCVTVILIPLVFVEAIAAIAGVFVGTAALSLLVGRRLYEMLSPRTTPTPVIALALGLVLITAAELVPVLGWLVTALVGVVGLGAAILSCVKEQSFTGIPIASNPSIGGPPMTIG